MGACQSNKQPSEPIVSEKIKRQKAKPTIKDNILDAFLTVDADRVEEF